MGNFKEDIARCEAMVFDVDGVFTRGGIVPLPDGDFLREYYAKDGYAVAYAVKHGFRLCIISGGRGRMLENRFKLLGIPDIYINCADKKAALDDFVNRHGLDPRNLIYMGDDIPDLEVMRSVGIPVCPADAAMEVVEASRYVSEYGGGQGCVRDIIEQVLRAKGVWAQDSAGVNCAVSG